MPNTRIKERRLFHKELPRQREHNRQETRTDDSYALQFNKQPTKIPLYAKLL